MNSDCKDSCVVRHSSELQRAALRQHQHVRLTGYVFNRYMFALTFSAVVEYI